MTHKYGIEEPTSVKHAYEIDAKKGNNFWRKALEKKMHNVGIAFKILDPMPMYQLVGVMLLNTLSSRCKRILHGRHNGCSMDTCQLTLTVPPMQV